MADVRRHSTLILHHGSWIIICQLQMAKDGLLRHDDSYRYLEYVRSKHVNARCVAKVESRFTIPEEHKQSFDQ